MGMNSDWEDNELGLDPSRLQHSGSRSRSPNDRMKARRGYGQGDGVESDAEFYSKSARKGRLNAQMNKGAHGNKGSGRKLRASGNRGAGNLTDTEGAGENQFVVGPDSDYSRLKPRADDESSEGDHRRVLFDG